MKLKHALIVMAISGMTISHAGFNKWTAHSRANCANNESIDWDATGYHTFCTISDHYRGGALQHEVNTGWNNTWRSAAVHWAEAAPGSGWTVKGIHWEIINRIPYNIANETVTDCSVYDGWWGFKNNKIESEKIETISMSDEDVKKLKSVPKGISIVSIKESAVPDSLKKTFIKQIEDKNSLSYKGYEESEKNEALSLLQIGKDSRKNLLDNDEPSDTHMKSKISHLTLAFPYEGMKFLDSKDVIGFSVSGTWVNDTENKGWNGVSEFFNDKYMGTCSYDLYNIKLTKGAVQLIKEEVVYEVNKKPTLINIKGNYNSGFLYRVDWFDDTYFSHIECANIKFDKNIITKMIDTAKKIDSQ